MSATISHIDLSDPVRQRVAENALAARVTLSAARRWLESEGFEQIRFDQYRNPTTGILVETGYTYGEARLVVHSPKPDYVSPVVTDFRLVGGDSTKKRYLEFKRVASGVF